MARLLTGNRTATAAKRGADMYPTPYGALAVLLDAEHVWLPPCLWEPACGNGALVVPLRNRGYAVHASDKFDWGCPNAHAHCDFLNEFERPREFIRGIVTNPPFGIIKPFIERACALAPYVAILARLAFLESETRFGWFQRMGLARVQLISDRLPMMHRHGYDGPKLSNAGMAFAWLVFESDHVNSGESVELRWWRWRDSVKLFPFQENDSPPHAVAGELGLFRRETDGRKPDPRSDKLGCRTGASGVSSAPGHELLPDP